MKKMNNVVLLILQVWLVMICFSMGCGSNEEVLYMDVVEDTVEVSSEDAGASEETTIESSKEEEDVSPNGILVHVCGAVEEPGVYELPEDSRVVNAVKAAGGMTDDADAEYVNLAAVVSDGDKVRIPTQEEVKQAEDEAEGKERISVITSVDGQASVNTSEKVQGKININTADIEELCTLPGIGQTRATSILAYRQENGGFSTIEDIMQVSGIKENCFQKIKDLITVN